MPNVLDRSDRSLTPVPRVSGKSAMIPKRKKNNWSFGGKPGRFRKISKSELNIDGRYQRGQVSEAKVQEIARSWDWALLGVILVVQRTDGTYWVFDGGHRTRAAFYRDDVNLLPCMVYSIDELSDEAKAFLGKNLMVTNVSSVDKFRAAVVASDETASKAAKLLKEFGLTVSFSAKNGKQFKCINTLISMIERDEALAKKCLAFCISRSENSPVSSSVMRGIFALCQHFADSVDVLEAFGDRLAQYSQREMEIRIRQMRAECGKGGEKVDALALLSLVNKGSKKKLAW